MEKSKRYTTTYPIAGEIITKANICRRLMPVKVTQKAVKRPMQSSGPSKVDTNLRQSAAEDTALNTSSLRVIIAAKPKRQSLTQSNQPKAALKPTPMIMKRSQIIQQTNDSARVRRVRKMGSSRKRTLLIRVSPVRVAANKAIPRKRLFMEGKMA
jgi:hypothetical protein